MQERPGPAPGVGCEDAVVSGGVDPRRRHQGGEPSEELVGFEEQEERAATGVLHPVDESGRCLGRTGPFTSRTLLTIRPSKASEKRSWRAQPRRSGPACYGRGRPMRLAVAPSGASARWGGAPPGCENRGAGEICPALTRPGYSLLHRIARVGGVTIQRVLERRALEVEGTLASGVLLLMKTRELARV